MNGPHDTNFRQIHGREIVASDLDAVATLLTKAFGYSREYFPQILDILTHHPTPSGFPKYGYVLLSGDLIVGAILLIFSTIRSGTACSIRCHVTSWSVDAPYRAYAAIFFSKALSHKDVTYLNVLQVPRSLPFIQLQGFSKFTDGQFAAIPLLSRGLGEGHVQLAPADAVSNTNVDAFQQELLLDHGKYGCISLWCITQESAYPFVFQPRRFKGIILGLQLVYCRHIDDFVRFARPIGLYLALRGRVFVSVNTNGPIPGLRGKYFAGARPLYFKGQMPHIGDLAYTQTVMHSQPRRALWLRGRQRRA
jgi:hypothetical protein